MVYIITDKGQSRLRNDLYSLNEKSNKIKKAKNKTNKGHTSILQNIYWVIGIISAILIINFTINEQFDFNIIKWIIHKF